MVDCKHEQPDQTFESWQSCTPPPMMMDRNRNPPHIDEVSFSKSPFLQFWYFSGSTTSIESEGQFWFSTNINCSIKNTTPFWSVPLWLFPRVYGFVRSLVGKDDHLQSNTVIDKKFCLGFAFTKSYDRVVLQSLYVCKYFDLKVWGRRGKRISGSFTSQIDFIYLLLCMTQMKSPPPSRKANVNSSTLYSCERRTYLCLFLLWEILGCLHIFQSEVHILGSIPFEWRPFLVSHPPSLLASRCRV